MPKDKPKKKTDDQSNMSAVPAPIKKSAGKAPVADAKSKAVKPVKKPVKSASVPEKVEEAPPAKKIQHKVVEAPAVVVKAPAKRPILTASEQRHVDNTVESPTPVGKASTTPAVPVEEAQAKSPETAGSVADEAALAAQHLQDKIVVIKPPIIVKDLAAKLGLKPYQIIHHLMEMNIFTSANQSLEEDIARKLCTKFGFMFEIEKREKGAGQVHAPVKIVEPPKPEPVAASELQSRPPVIAFMGHVDHGKTSLLDAIRKARVEIGRAHV